MFSLILAVSLTLIQNNINNRVTYVADAPGHDVWQAAKQNGDCEDIALAKREVLLKHGYSPDDLQLILVFHPVRHSGHVILYVASQDKVLDLQRGIGPEGWADWQHRTGMIRLCKITDVSYGEKTTGQRCEAGTPRTVEDLQ